MSVSNSVFYSPVLGQYLSKSGHKAASPADAASSILEIAKLSRREFLQVLQGFDDNLDTLESSLSSVQEVIGILEEAGGLSVRARNFLQEDGGAKKYKDKLADLELWYNKTLEKLDAYIEKSEAGGGVNLLKGDSLTILFDPAGQSTLLTQGINLTAKGLGIRPPDFSSLHNIQNARIDITNSIDLAVTLRNIVSSDISTIKTRREFCETALSFLTQIHDYLTSAGPNDEPHTYLDLCQHIPDLADGEPLAAEPQLVTLENFRTQ
ncbi:MAG TPA: hypothetical protein PKI93_08205 [Alphaproteobacteria bacterium]|nr:hypothetical protein [Alphaproteobacteria bacterium]HNS44093.1 hypothetical protein [Alphaproteobacteria bacterium]